MSRTETAPRGVLVNRTRLAHIFGVSLPTIDAWVRKGMPYVQPANRDRGREWQFDTAACIDWRVQQVRARPLADPFGLESGDLPL